MAGERLREGRVSLATGGYCQGRCKMPRLIANCVCDHILEQLQELMREGTPEVGQSVFLIDGTTVRLPHEKELVRAFPPGHNQHGKNHWPTMLMVAFHDCHTGLAMRPVWGPMYGKKAVGEQALACQALERLPANAVVMADLGFGIFVFAYAVEQSRRPLLFRLSRERAGKVLGGQKLRAGRRRKVNWVSSKYERKTYPELPEEAVVKGWVHVCRHPQKRDELLYFFTTLDRRPRQILALYGLRWNMETDLRSLKRTLELHQVAGRSKDMVEKEIVMAVCAYNVVRGVMCLSASAAGVAPRQLSFSTAQDAVMAAWPYLQRAQTAAEFREELHRLVGVVARAKLPKRSRRRSYPRMIWGRGGHFPFHPSKRVRS